MHLTSTTSFRSNTKSVKDDRVHDAVANAIIGAAPGANVTVTSNRVKATGDTGGRVGIEAATLFNRITNASDVAELKAEVVGRTTSLQFPVDKSGNGGPAFNRT